MRTGSLNNSSGKMSPDKYHCQRSKETKRRRKKKKEGLRETQKGAERDREPDTETDGRFLTFSPGGAWPGDSPGSPFEP